MTPTTSPDLAALYAAVLDHPEEDTPRLMLADALDEQAGGLTPRGELLRIQCELARRNLQSLARDAVRCTDDCRCVKCGAIWHWLDGDPNLGWTLLSAKCGVECCDNVPMDANCVALATDEVALLNRERELLSLLAPTLHACPVCRGLKSLPEQEQGTDGQWRRVPVACPHCSGSGRVGTFSRGLVEVVRVPRLSDVLEQEEVSEFTDAGEVVTYEWTATPWARALFANHPCVRAVEVADRVPHYNGYGHAWFDSERMRASLAVPDGAELPRVLFAQLVALSLVGIDKGKGEIRLVDGRFLAFPTADLARAALARAVADVLRRVISEA